MKKFRNLEGCKINMQYFKLEKEGEPGLSSDLSVKNAGIYEKCADFIRKGEVVAFPTETVYGLGANMYDEEAVLKIFELKKRQKSKSLVIMMSDILQIDAIAQNIPDVFYKLAKKYMPGSITVILQKNKNLKKNISNLISNDDTIGVRIPSNVEALRLIEEVGSPIVATSANISGEKDPKKAEDVKNSFKDEDVVMLDGGECELGVPSTVVSLVDQEDVKILREGAISQKEIFEFLRS
jgi:L-threonylcarbamoyladenylate synthase